MKTFVSLTKESFVASDQIVSIVVREYMFTIPLKDLTTTQRKDLLDSEDRCDMPHPLLCALNKVRKKKDTTVQTCHWNGTCSLAHPHDPKEPS